MPETSGIPLPAGYTAQTLQDYYQSLIQPIGADTAGQRGVARTEAFARGLEGTPTETGGVAAAQYYGGQRRDVALGQLGMGMAGLAGEQEMQRQGWGFQSAEAEKQREWQTKQAEMQRAYMIGTGEAERGAAEQASRRATQLGIFSALVG